LPTLGFKRENIFIVPVSIPEEWLRVEKRDRVVAASILWLGKFRRYKCPDHIVASMPAIVRAIPGAQLILAGRHDDRKYEADLLAMAHRLGIADSVQFCFDLSEDEKRSLVERSKVVVVPSSVEGFGIVVLEANSCGVPVVASSGVPESVVAHEGNGLRYTFGDSHALAAALIRLLGDNQLYDLLSERSSRFARSFDWQEVGSAFEKAIRTVSERRVIEPAWSPQAWVDRGGWVRQPEPSTSIEPAPAARRPNDG
jgi:glycosyltransferase involved in cell wall biosynthesis